jgi:hypothetical protein
MFHRLAEDVLDIREALFDAGVDGGKLTGMFAFAVDCSLDGRFELIEGGEDLLRAFRGEFVFHIVLLFFRFGDSGQSDMAFRNRAG